MSNFSTVLGQVIQWFGTITNNVIDWLNRFEINFGPANFTLFDLILTILIISICISIFITTPKKSEELEKASKFWHRRMRESEIERGNDDD